MAFPRLLPRTERGIALVVALLVLLVLSMLAVVLMTTVTIETKIAGHSSREGSALNIAEAGIAEALSQIRAGNVALDPSDPRGVVQIFNTIPGSVPVLGTDSTALPTLQPAGQWLDYSTANKSGRALTVEYRTDGSRSVVYRYDPNANPHVQTSTGSPIFKVTSTGLRGPDRRTVVAEFIQKPITVLAKGALVSNVPVLINGTAYVCGQNHRSDTPAGTGFGGHAECQPWEIGTGPGFGNMPGIWGGSTITIQGAGKAYGSPDSMSHQTNFYPGPWSVFGMSQAQFFAWVGPGQWPLPANPTGIINIDNDNVSENLSVQNAGYQGGNGEGFLYVDGDFTINGNFTYRGLVYVEGDLNINGTVWILGGLVVKGQTLMRVTNGNLCVLYSADAIQQKIQQYGSQFSNISWREF